VNFDDLLVEGAAVPVAGWDFSWFDGRATEERPAWGYSRLMGERMAAASVAVDLQTGGGEVLAAVPAPPPVLLATESWSPNLAIAARNLRPVGGHVVRSADDGALPFAAGTFDLVVSRHPTDVDWSEIARVLRPGGTYLSQQIGAGGLRELMAIMIGKRGPIDTEYPERQADIARRAGLDVVDLRKQLTRMEFFDIAAVVYFLRKVFWFVPDFTVAGYRAQLAEVHERIEADGSFVTHSSRFLIEVTRA
jgi:SAM-dependent methyltransferase